MNGSELRKIIRGSGKTIDEAAELLGISRQTLSGYFSKGYLKPEFIQNVRDVFTHTLSLDPGEEYDSKITAKGDSMAPFICSGDEVGLKKVYSIVYGNCHYVKTKDFELLRYVHKLEGNRLLLRSFYPEQYQDIEINQDDVVEVYRLVYVYRKL